MSAAVLRCLDKEQLRTVALSLVDGIYKSAESLEVLCLIVSLLDDKDRNEIKPKLIEFLLLASTEGNQVWTESSLLFIQDTPSLLKPVIAHIAALLEVETTFKFNFVQKISLESNNNANRGDDALETDQILHIFLFLSQLFTAEIINKSPDINQLDRILSNFLGHKDESIALECSKLLRWRIDSICQESLADETSEEYYWSLIWALKDSASSKIHESNAAIMWLRILANSHMMLRADKFFQENIINQEFYWQLLQDGLASTSHEHRKFSLSILQYSVKLIDSCISTEIFTWDTLKSDQLLREWSRYTTLYEILGVDTSLHQLQAATNDILYLMSPESLVHASWGYCLLSTGFQASMDSVRKATAAILLDLDESSFQSLKYGLPFYEKQFLPYMMLSRHFSVRRVHSSTNSIHCEYGARFSEFLSSVIKSIESLDEKASFVRSTLRVLIATKDSFDAVKIYTTWGVVKGLDSLRALKPGFDDSLLIELFDSPTEGELYQKVIQSLNLRLVLALDVSNANQAVDILLKFVNHNGYQIFCDNIPRIKQYLESQQIADEALLEVLESEISLTEAIVSLKLMTSPNNALPSMLNDLKLRYGDLIVTRLVEVGFKSNELKNLWCSILSSALNGSVSIDVYESLVEGMKYCSPTESSSLGSLWSNIVSSLHAPSASNVIQVLARQRLFNAVLQATGPQDVLITIDEITDLLQSSFKNTSELAQAIAGFYKLKKNIFGELHHSLFLLVSESGIPRSDVAGILSALHFESTHTLTLTSICSIIKQMFDKEVTNPEQIVSIAEQLLCTVQSLNEDRFKLEDRKAHNLLIEVFLHPFLLSRVEYVPELNHCELQFANIIIENAYARRGLLPRYFECLIQFQTSSQACFEALPFIVEVLMKAMTLRQLSNSVFNIEGIIGKLFDENLSASESNDLYFDIYGPEEVAYNANLYAIVNSFKSQATAQRMMEACLTEPSPLIISDTVSSNDGNEEYSRCQIAKIIVSVLNTLDLESSSTTNLPKLFDLVENEPSPLVRIYLEWAIAYHLVHYPQLVEMVFDKLLALLKRHELRPVVVTIYEKILFLAIQSMEPDNELIYISKLISVVIPAAATNKAVTRHFSMSLAISIYEEINKKKLNLNPELLAIVENMYSNAIATNAFSQFRSGSSCLWDVIGDLDLVHVSGGLLVELNNREVEHVTCEEFEKYLSSSAINNLNIPIGKPRDSQWSASKTESEEPAFSEQSQKKLSPLQTKSGAWSTVMDVDKKTELADIVRSDLIVVASLVDKPPNLGGICRLCDVLGAGLLTLHDKKVKEHPQFKNVAVTADHWMPMTEVKPEQIVTYLREKKAEGYTLMGLEQTDKSVVLDSKLEFPKKTLILLGREKEGIPGELLAELDLCVEIKQVGVIRSMNIQTATAVIVHAYSSQNC